MFAKTSAWTLLALYTVTFEGHFQKSGRITLKSEGPLTRLPSLEWERAGF